MYGKTSTKLQPNNQTFLAKPNQTKNIRPTRVEPNQSPPCSLRSIIAAVDHKADVYLDGGITLGTDVLKAIALGAKMVFVGRPVLWGLAYDGQKGVERVLEILRLELDMAMALAGIEKIDKIKGDFVVLPKSVL